MVRIKRGERNVFHSIIVKYIYEKKSQKKGQKSLVLRTGKGNERRKPRKEMNIV